MLLPNSILALFKEEEILLTPWMIEMTNLMIWTSKSSIKAVLVILRVLVNTMDWYNLLLLIQWENSEKDLGNILKMQRMLLWMRKSKQKNKEDKKRQKRNHKSLLIKSFIGMCKETNLILIRNLVSFKITH